MLEIKNTNKYEECLRWDLQLIGHNWGKNQWAWKYANCNFPNEKQRKKSKNNGREYWEPWDSYQVCTIHIMGITEEERKRDRRNIQSNNAK